jgi:hypothetical protein
MFIKMVKTMMIILVITTVSISSSCKDENLCKWDDMPFSLILKLTKTDIILNDDQLNSCKLSYYKEGVKKYMSDFSLSKETQNQGKGLIGTRLIGLLSADSNIKTYYIEYPVTWQWKSDTLLVDYLPRTQATNCRYLQNEVKVNGQSASIDNDFHFDTPVFIVNKP